jgi:hypothetical protein
LNVLTAIVSRKQHTEGTYDAPLWLVAHIRVGLGTMLSTRAAEVGYNVMANVCVIRSTIYHMNFNLFLSMSINYYLLLKSEF